MSAVTGWNYFSLGMFGLALMCELVLLVDMIGFLCKESRREKRKNNRKSDKPNGPSSDTSVNLFMVCGNSDQQRRYFHHYLGYLVAAVLLVIVCLLVNLAEKLLWIAGTIRIGQSRRFFRCLFPNARFWFLHKLYE